MEPNCPGQAVTIEARVSTESGKAVRGVQNPNVALTPLQCQRGNVKAELRRVSRPDFISGPQLQPLSHRQGTGALCRHEVHTQGQPLCVG